MVSRLLSRLRSPAYLRPLARVWAANLVYAPAVVIITVLATRAAAHRALATLAAMLLVYYWAHRLSHVPGFRANVHAWLHHGAAWRRLGNHWALRAAADAAECQADYWVGCGLLLLPGVAGVLDPAVTVMVGVTHALVHGVNYHLRGPHGRAIGAAHRRHHADAGCNYGPSIVDALFGTYDLGEDEPPEDMWHMLPPLALAAAMARAAFA